jgi:transcriptional regulator with XRE-family HTH domain
MLGVTFQQVQKYEKGVNRISSSRLQAIANALGVTAPYFFEDHLVQAPEGENVRREIFNEFLASRDGVTLMQAFTKIKDEGLRRAIAQLIAELQD